MPKNAELVSEFLALGLLEVEGKYPDHAKWGVCHERATPGLAERGRVFEESLVRPMEIDEVSAETRRENADDRVRFGGPGAELLRRAYIAHLRSQMEAFYEHGTLADVVLLSQAFELSEQASTDCAKHHAPVLESVLGLVGIEPLDALKCRR